MAASSTWNARVRMGSEVHEITVVGQTEAEARKAANRVGILISLERAKKSGYSALILTIDTAVPGNRAHHEWMGASRAINGTPIQKQPLHDDTVIGIRRRREAALD